MEHMMSYSEMEKHRKSMKSMPMMKKKKMMKHKEDDDEE